MTAKGMQCPLCDEAFDDDAALTGHLGALHELYDDEGTSSEDSLAARLEPDGDEGADPADPSRPSVLADDAAAELIDGIPASRVYDPTAEDAKWRPVVIVACLLLLLGAGVGFMTVLSPSDPDGTGEVAGGTTTTGVEAMVAATVALQTTTTLPAATDTTVAPPPPAASSTPTTAAAPTPTTLRSAPAPAPAPAPPPPPPPPPTTAPPTTAPPPPPPPPPVYAPPTATGARIDGCTRSGSDATWRFSYALSGGSGWSPASSATASEGRWLEARTDKFRNGFSVAAIQVVDFNGFVHDIPLDPPLATDRCR